MSFGIPERNKPDHSCQKSPRLILTFHRFFNPIIRFFFGYLILTLFPLKIILPKLLYLHLLSSTLVPKLPKWDYFTFKYTICTHDGVFRVSMGRFVFVVVCHFQQFLFLLNYSSFNYFCLLYIFIHFIEPTLFFIGKLFISLKN